MRQPISLASNSPNVTTVPAGCQTIAGLASLFFGPRCSRTCMPAHPLRHQALRQRRALRYRSRASQAVRLRGRDEGRPDRFRPRESQAVQPVRRISPHPRGATRLPWSRPSTPAPARRRRRRRRSGAARPDRRTGGGTTPSQWVRLILRSRRTASMNATSSRITVVSSAGTQTTKRDRMLCACLMTVGGAPP